MIETDLVSHMRTFIIRSNANSSWPVRSTHLLRRNSFVPRGTEGHTTVLVSKCLAIYNVYVVRAILMT